MAAAHRSRRRNLRGCHPQAGPEFLRYRSQRGAEELFAAFGNALGKSSGFLLNRHGPVVPGRDVMDAFFRLEELEESARIAWELRNETDFPIA